MLTPQKKIFVDEWIANKRNATQAAIAAGYSPKTARVQASRMLNTDEIKEYAQERLVELYAPNRGTIDECISLLMDIARTDVSDIYNEDGSIKAIKDMPRHAKQAITEVEQGVEYEWDELLERRVPRHYIKKIKLEGKKGALVEVLKIMGGYKLDNEQKAVAPIQLTINPLSAGPPLDNTIDITPVDDLSI